MLELASYLEFAMLVAFGCSWPTNILTSLKNKSTKGKNLAFLILIDFGYFCGIAAKFIAGNPKIYVVAIYILNAIMVTTDMCLYFYYKSKEQKEKI